MNRPSALEAVAAVLRNEGASLVGSTEAKLEQNVADRLRWHHYTVRTQERTRDGKSRYDLVCWPREDAPPVRIELKMRLDAGHFKQFDRYLQARDERPLIAVGWRCSPRARAALRDLAAEFPDRFALVVLSDRAALG